MRLTCPNCGAQYEVPDEVIPASGRDVQCSNCGDTWFQRHPDFMPESNDVDFEEDLEESPTRDPNPDDETRFAEEFSDLPQMEVDEWEDLDVPGGQSMSPEVGDTGQGERGPGNARKVDPAIAEILRDEAEHERRARAQEHREGIETQPDLGLASASQRTAESNRVRQSSARLERLRGHEPDEDVSTQTAALDADTRRNLLPDIEEISSSLKSAESRSDLSPEALDGDQDYGDTPSGFRRGFRLSVLIFLLAALIYVLAPRIAVWLPASEPYLTYYMSAVDSARIWLHRWIAGLTGGHG